MFTAKEARELSIQDNFEDLIEELTKAIKESKDPIHGAFIKVKDNLIYNPDYKLKAFVDILLNAGYYVGICKHFHDNKDETRIRVNWLPDLDNYNVCGMLSPITHNNVYCGMCEGCSGNGDFE